MVSAHNFKSVTYRAVGMRHIEKNKPCEDNVFCYSSKEGVLCAALSDGAGSYKYAAIGSDIAARTSATFLAEKFERLYGLDNGTIAEYVQHEVLRPIEELASKEKEDVIQYSATLLCVALHPDGRYIILHVGDGAIVGLNLQNKTEVISLYEHTGPANQTSFITDSFLEAFVKKGNGEYASFIMMSDGPEDFLVSEVGANPRVRLIQQLAFFLDEDSMHQQLESLLKLLTDHGMDDDASFAIVCDMREFSTVLLSVSPEFRKMMFSIENDFSKAKKKRLKQILNVISDSPTGVTLHELTQRIYSHSKTITKRKIDFLCSMNIIKQENGRFFIS